MGIRPEYTNYHDYLKWRLDRRCQVIRDRADKVLRRYVSTTDKEKNDGEDDRLWLDQFAKGNGLDICCGDFLVGTDDQASGVDGDNKMVGVDYFREGDDLCFQQDGTLDFVVTNYLDGMPNPIRALVDWSRVLKPGGVLAIAVRDADADYPGNPMGALANPRKQSTYNKVTLSHYLYRCGFRDIKTEQTAHGTLRCSSVKG